MKTTQGLGLFTNQNGANNNLLALKWRNCSKKLNSMKNSRKKVFMDKNRGTPGMCYAGGIYTLNNCATNNKILE